MGCFPENRLKEKEETVDNAYTERMDRESMSPWRSIQGGKRISRYNRS